MDEITSKIILFGFKSLQRLLFTSSPKLYKIFYGFLKGISDKMERDICKRFIKPDMIILDIGANIGIYTEFFISLLSNQGHVYAFEPAPYNFQLLEKHFSKVKTVTLNKVAVGDTNQQLMLYLSTSLNVDHRIYADGEDRIATPVQCIKLDDYFTDKQTVDFVKMDIQGAEYQALLGMQRLLNQNEAVKLLFEYYPEGLSQAGTSGQLLLDFLKRNRFRVYEIKSGGNLTELMDKLPNLNRLGYCNFLAARELLV